MPDLLQSGDVPDPWRMIPVLRAAVRDLFPSARRKRALWTLIALSGVTTVAELAAARFFGSLITGSTSADPGRSVLLLGLFLISFGAIKGAGYLQNVYKLAVFDRSLGETAMQDAAGQAWQWPLAMELVSLLTQVSRLLMVTAVIAVISPPFAALGVICAGLALLIIARGGRRQFDVQLAFVIAQASGARPTPSEKVAARIIGAERAGLATMGPVILLVAVLGYGALAGFVPLDQALVLFIATRIMANMYGTMAGSVMRFVRAQVYVLRASVDLSSDDPTDPDPAPTTTASGDSLASIREILEAPPYRGLPAPQAHVALLDDGTVLGDVPRLRLALRSGAETSARPRPAKGPFVRTRCRASAPNQAWRYLVADVPTTDGEPLRAVIVLDVFSRQVLAFRVGEGEDCVDLDTTIAAAIEAAASAEGVDRDHIAIYADAATPWTTRPLSDALKDLGVYRSVTQASDESGCPPLPAGFADAAQLRSWLTGLQTWYNLVHYVPELGWFHPIDVHRGHTDQIVGRRVEVLRESYLANPEWFSAGMPTVHGPPIEAYVRAPEITTVTAEPVPVSARDGDGSPPR